MKDSRNWCCNYKYAEMHTMNVLKLSKALLIYTQTQETKNQWIKTVQHLGLQSVLDDIHRINSHHWISLHIIVFFNNSFKLLINKILWTINIILIN